MSLADLTIQFTDRRDSTGQVLVVFGNVPLELSEAELRYIIGQFKERIMNAVVTRKGVIGIQALRTMLLQGKISQGVYDELTS